jgi:hypothetical protein
MRSETRAFGHLNLHHRGRPSSPVFGDLGEQDSKLRNHAVYPLRAVHGFPRVARVLAHRSCRPPGDDLINGKRSPRPLFMDSIA